MDVDKSTAPVAEASTIVAPEAEASTIVAPPSDVNIIIASEAERTSRLKKF